MIDSSLSEISSNIPSRASLLSFNISSGISISSNFEPRESPSQIANFISIKSIIPSNKSFLKYGMWSFTGLEFNLSLIWSYVLWKLAPVLSILFTKHILGTPYLSACLHTVSDWGSTPPTLSKTTHAPSKTFNDLSTSIVKSTCPGVSIIFMSWSAQLHAVVAEVIVMPLSLSCSIQSIVAAPSWTSPIL